MQWLNQFGGIGVMHTKKFDTFVIGRVESPCVHFAELTDDAGNDRQFKTFQFTEY